MANDTIRIATLADVPQIAEVFASGFIEDDVFARFMHPKRKEYPADWLRYWNRDIRTHYIEQSVLIYVRTNKSGVVKACCVMRRLGSSADNMSPKSSILERAYATTINNWERLTWTDQSADPKALEVFDRNWEDIKHHFTGPRAESWMIELFCVAPDVQNGGYGRQLIEKAIELCKSEAPAVPLCVIASEIGDGFYERMGFHEVGRANVGDMSDVVGGIIKFNEQHLQR